MEKSIFLDTKKNGLERMRYSLSLAKQKTGGNVLFFNDNKPL